MGSSESKVEHTTKVIVERVGPDPAEIAECQAAVEKCVKDQLQEMKAEISEVAPIITQGVHATQDKVEGCDIMEYEDLQDISKVVKDLEKTFKGCNGHVVIIEMATGAIEAMKDRKELKKMTRWQQRQRIQVVSGRSGQPDKIVGIELHYKVVVADETISENVIKKYYKKWTASDYEHKKTTVIVAYKVLTHAMEGDPSKLLSGDQLKAIDF